MHTFTSLSIPLNVPPGPSAVNVLKYRRMIKRRDRLWWGLQPRRPSFSNPTMISWLHITGPADAARAVGASVHFGNRSWNH